MTRTDRLTGDDYLAAMAALDWESRRRVELASHRGGLLDDPAHAALAAERGRRAIVRMCWGLVTAPVAALLLWLGLETGEMSPLWFGGFVALVFLIVLSRLLVYQRARSQHLMNADFDELRRIATQHRMTYRRRD